MNDDAFADEIVEIFVEEADDVLAQIDEHFSTWKMHPDNERALKEIRRAFHTLKGSGRMVQAEDLGELAWSVENMLNRVIDGTLAPNALIIELVQVVRGVIPSMVNAFKNRQAAALLGINFAMLIEQANNIVAGNPVESLNHFKPADESKSQDVPVEDVLDIGGMEMHADLNSVEVQAVDERVSELKTQLSELKRDIVSMSTRMDTIAAQVKLMPKAVDAEGVGRQLSTMNQEVQELKYFLKATSEQMLQEASENSKRSSQKLEKEVRRSQQASQGIKDDVEISLVQMQQSIIGQIKIWSLGSAIGFSLAVLTYVILTA